MIDNFYPKLDFAMSLMYRLTKLGKYLCIWKMLYISIELFIKQRVPEESDDNKIIKLIESRLLRADAAPGCAPHLHLMGVLYSSCGNRETPQWGLSECSCVRRAGPAPRVARLGLTNLGTIAAADSLPMPPTLKASQ